MSTENLPTFEWNKSTKTWSVRGAYLEKPIIGHLSYEAHCASWMYAPVHKGLYYPETLAHITLKLFELNENEDSTN